DAQVGTFVDELERRGCLSRTRMMITADHGESFLERGDWEHGLDGHQEQVRVPLIAFGPEVTARGAIDVPVQTLDIMPTILSWAKLSPPYPLAGHSLADRLKQGDTTKQGPRTLFGSNAYYLPTLKRTGYYAIKDGRWKLVYQAKLEEK